MTGPSSFRKTEKKNIPTDEKATTDGASMADEDKKSDSKKEGGSGKNPLLTILILLNAVLMGAVAFMQFQAHQREASTPSVQDVISAEMKKLNPEDSGSTETGEAKPEDGILFPLEPFTANLAQGDGPRRYLRLNAVLKFSKDSSESEFKARKPQIRDAIISTLNSKRPQDLLKVEGKQYLKEEIKSSINAFLVDGQVIDVFYVGFQIN